MHAWWSGPYKPGPSKVALPTGSVALHSPMTSPASSRSRTSTHGTNIVRSHSNSASSTGSKIVELKLPAGSRGEGKDSKSTSKDGSETNEEGGAGCGDKAPGDGECQDGQALRAVTAPWKLMVRFWPEWSRR